MYMVLKMYNETKNCSLRTQYNMILGVVLVKKTVYGNIRSEQTKKLFPVLSTVYFGVSLVLTRKLTPARTQAS